MRYYHNKHCDKLTLTCGDVYVLLYSIYARHLILSEYTKSITLINCEIDKISISSSTVIIKADNCNLTEINAIEELMQDKIYILDVRNNPDLKKENIKINIPILEYYQ